MKARLHYDLPYYCVNRATHIDIKVETISFAETLFEENSARRQGAWLEVFDDKDRLVYKRDVYGSVERHYYTSQPNFTIPDEVADGNNIFVTYGVNFAVLEAYAFIDEALHEMGYRPETDAEKIKRLEVEVDELDEENDTLREEVAETERKLDEEIIAKLRLEDTMKTLCDANNALLDEKHRLKTANATFANAASMLMNETNAARSERNRWRDRAVAAETTPRDAIKSAPKSLPWVVLAGSRFSGYRLVAAFELESKARSYADLVLHTLGRVEHRS